MSSEIIVKRSFMIDATGDAPFSVPELLLLANREGFRELASLFTQLSERQIDNKCADHGDPDDHTHLSFKFGPCNTQLSDRIEFRFGLLTDENRVAVFQKYEIGEHAHRPSSFE